MVEACCNGHLGVIRFLLALPGFDVNQLLEDPPVPVLTLFTYASMEDPGPNLGEVMRLLLNHPGTDANRMGPQGPPTPLDAALQGDLPLLTEMLIASHHPLAMNPMEE